MEKIIVGVDGSESAAAALRWAAREAELRETGLAAVLAWGFLDQHLPVGADGFDREYGTRHARDALASYVEAALPGRDIERVELRAVCDLPARALLDAAAGGSLLVVGARGLGGFGGLLLGSVSQRCLHHAPCPVAVVRGEGAPTRTDGERLVVGVDGSDAAGDALRWALDEARLRRASLEVVHAWHIPYVGDYLATTMTDPKVYEEAARSALDEQLEEVDTSGLAVPVEPVLVQGGASGAILATAKGADLIVVGSHGRGGVSGLILGSVSQQVTHHADCPVVVVPPAG